MIDYKSSDVTEQKAADKRARESLQLKVYALADEAATGRLPARVELRFLESGLSGRYRPVAADLLEAREAILVAAAGIRARRFEATPSYQVCRYCPYNQICPSTATREFAGRSSSSSVSPSSWGTAPTPPRAACSP